jgi:hypothetical protein
MPQRDDVADRKDASNVRPRRYDEMIWTRYERIALKESYPHGIENLGHAEEHHTRQPLLFSSLLRRLQVL